MHDTDTPHTHEPAEDAQNPSSPPSDPKADHDANHQDKKVDGCEFC